MGFLKPQSPPPAHRAPLPREGARSIAWLALIFSFLAFMMSGAALLMHFENSPFVRNAQRRLSAFQNSLPAPKKSSGAPPAASAAPRPSAADSTWDQVREKLYRAEAMIRNQDGRVKDYLAGLRSELERLGDGKTTEQAGQWIADASEKLKAIRQQVAVNGPEAARRLREMASDLQQQARTFQRVGDALRAVAPGRASRPSTPPDPAGARNPEVPAVPLREDYQQ